MMSFEKLDVYQVAIDFLGRATQINQSSPKGNADLHDQLKRAAISIPLNIAEAAGKTSPPDIRRFFAIARGSAMDPKARWHSTDRQGAELFWTS